jgi:hypothetical protein
MMRPLAWMGAAGAGAWLLVTAATAGRANPEAFLGMLGPLAVAGATWIVTERTWRRAPGRLTRVAVAGFALRMALFAVFIVAMVRAFTSRPAEFVIGFASCFVAVYAVEAVFLRRLLSTHVST